MTAENEITYQTVNYTKDTLTLPIDIWMYNYHLSLFPQLLAQFTITTDYTNIYNVSKNYGEVLGGSVSKKARRHHTE
jgi:hypothetical protein